jgi:protein-S-isoprenylcysteine O-methyltransferase Ste14
LALAFALLFRPWPFTRLDTRFVPEAEAIQLCGVVLTAVGVVFAIWARRKLGRDWSGGLTTIKEDHKLMR